jgi:hypothetical protein
MMTTRRGGEFTFGAISKPEQGHTALTEIRSS